MNMLQSVITICVTLTFLSSANASDGLYRLMNEYRGQGGGPFSAAAGRELWSPAFQHGFRSSS